MNNNNKDIDNEYYRKAIYDNLHFLQKSLNELRNEYPVTNSKLNSLKNYYVTLNESINNDIDYRLDNLLNDDIKTVNNEFEKSKINDNTFKGKLDKSIIEVSNNDALIYDIQHLDDKLKNIEKYIGNKKLYSST